MFCTKCGKPIADGCSFCTSCGAPAPAAKPASASTPSPAPAPTQRPTAKPAPTPAARPAPRPASKKRLSGGVIGLIITAVILAVAAIGLLIFFLWPDNDKDAGSRERASQSPAVEDTADPTLDDDALAAQSSLSPSAAPSEVPAAYDISMMNGTYYCAQEAGSTLELYSQGDQLSIYKTYSGTVDVSTLIDAPEGPNFIINYGGRRIEFYYSASGRSVTVTEGGYSSIFTTDGDQNWVADTTEGMPDPFNDPNGYILPTDSQYITESDLYSFSEEEVKLIRNEIYARHGYSFTLDKFRDYFNTKSWYHENTAVNANTFGTQQMNDYERANVDVIKAYEERMGW